MSTSVLVFLRITSAATRGRKFANRLYQVITAVNYHRHKRHVQLNAELGRRTCVSSLRTRCNMRYVRSGVRDRSSFASSKEPVRNCSSVGTAGTEKPVNRLTNVLQYFTGFPTRTGFHNKKNFLLHSTAYSRIIATISQNKKKIWCTVLRTCMFYT
jgi:hypothetical protein